MTSLIYWSIAWASGVWLGSKLALPYQVWAGVALIIFLAAVLIRPFGTRRLFFCLVALALGALRLTLAEPRFDSRSLATYNGHDRVTLVGVVADGPDVRGSFVFYRLDAKSLLLPDSDERLEVTGAARVRGPRYPVYEYGDRLQVEGNLQKPPLLEGFNYRDYLARKGIHSQIPYAEIEWLSSGDGTTWKRAMLTLKDRAHATIGRLLPEPEASLLSGILLGVEGGIPPDLYEDFRTTGASHVIAISGFNISIVAGLLMATLGRAVKNRWLAAGVTIAGVVAYTILVGADAAVVRAAVMGGVTVIAMTLERPGWPLNTVAAAVFLMTAINPHFLWDVGFQLSVFATLGLIVYGKWFEEVTQRLLARKLSAERAQQIVGQISDALLLTLAAQIATTPLILWHFGRLPIISLFSNFLILPAQPLVMGFGGAATLAGLLFEPLGRAIGWAAYLPLTWTIRVVEWTARLPYASIPFELSDWGLVGVYALIGAATLVALTEPERRRSLWEGMRTSVPVAAGLGGMTVLALTAWLVVLQFPDGTLHVTFLDVGQGDAILVQTPGGAQILVDGGPEGGTLLSELGRQMPFWDRTLDLVVLTHPEADHLTGLIPALERYAVAAVLARAQPLETDLVDTWKTALATEGATVIRGEAGTRLDLSDGVALEILRPGPGLFKGTTADTNNNSIVVRLTYGEVAFLLPGDIEAEVEKDLVRSGAYIRSTVLKVPHHGSKTSSCQAFLEAVSPQVAVISVGEDNGFGHPSSDVLARLKDILVYRTDLNGTVTVASDGHRLWVDKER